MPCGCVPSPRDPQLNMRFNSAIKDNDYAWWIWLFQRRTGQVLQPDVTYHLPVYLDTEVFDYFAQKAKRKGIEVNTLINELLKKDIDIIEGIN